MNDFDNEETVLQGPMDLWMRGIIYMTCASKNIRVCHKKKTFINKLLHKMIHPFISSISSYHHQSIASIHMTT